MVVFTCNHCGETLHKPKVEKHYQFTCRNYKSVTCVDCFKDFRDEEYVVHTKCITEDERYSAKGTYKNGIVKKGEVKQDNWLEMIKSICEAETSLKPSIRNLLETILEYTNVPRKKQKFMNFIRSSSGNRANMKDVEEVWDIIEKYKTKSSPYNQNKQKTKEPEGEQKELKNGVSESEKQTRKRANHDNTEEESPKKRNKKSSMEIIENINNIEKNKKQNVEPFQGTKQVFMEETSNTMKKNKQKALITNSDNSSELQETQSSEFSFKEKILEILQQKQSISHKKLQKKILKAYVGFTGQSDCEEKVIKKFNKKLKKISNVGIEDDRVVLVTN